MYKLIIADDEQLVRNSLPHLLPWEEYQIQIIGTASDGQEAYDLAMAHKPDILLTDIRMPHMDGLELSAKLREEQPDLKIIIISGFSDFTYAKTALELDVNDYILKPIKVKDLTQVIRKVLSELTKEKNLHRYIEDLRQQMSDFQLLAKDKFLMNLLLGLPIHQDHLIRKLRYLELPFGSSEQLTVAVVEPDTYDELCRTLSEEDLQLLLFSIHNIISEIMENYDAGVCIQLQDHQLVVLFKAHIFIEDQLLFLCSQMQQAIQRYLNHSVSIGIGYPVSSLSMIQSSYSHALKALQYRFYTGKESINQIDDFDSFPVSQSLDTFKFHTLGNELLDTIQLGDSARVQELINTLHALLQESGLPIPTIRHHYLDILMQISRQLYSSNNSIRSILENDQLVTNTMMHATVHTSMTNALSSHCLELAQFFFDRMAIRHRKMIEQIQAYIHKNYMMELTVGTISENVFLTPNYVSLIFKQETQMTVIEYLTQVRIEKAKELLQSPDLKVFEVAEMVGYPNPRYFSKVFKKATGVHPKQYKDMLL